MISTKNILTNNPMPQTLINAMYNYYEKNDMTIGELYLLLKMIVSNLEDELEKIGMLESVSEHTFTPPITNTNH